MSEDGKQIRQALDAAYGHLIEREGCPVCHPIGKCPTLAAINPAIVALDCLEAENERLTKLVADAAKVVEGHHYKSPIARLHARLTAGAKPEAPAKCRNCAMHAVAHAGDICPNCLNIYLQGGTLTGMARSSDTVQEPEAPAEVLEGPPCQCGHGHFAHMRTSGATGGCGAMVPWENTKRQCLCDAYVPTLPAPVAAPATECACPARKALEAVPCRCAKLVKSNNCPLCGSVLHVVGYPAGSMLNREQFDAVKAGDYYCTSCKGAEATTGYKYFWEREFPVRIEKCARCVALAAPCECAGLRGKYPSTGDKLRAELAIANERLASVAQDRSALISSAIKRGLVVSCGRDGHQVTHEPELALSIALIRADDAERNLTLAHERIATLEQEQARLVAELSEQTDAVNLACDQRDRAIRDRDAALERSARGKAHVVGNLRNLTDQFDEWLKIANHDLLARKEAERQRDAALEDLKSAVDALRPFETFSRKWHAKPLRGIDNEIYTIHAGEDSASLRLSDCDAASAIVARFDAQGGGK